MKSTKAFKKAREKLDVDITTSFAYLSRIPILLAEHHI